MEKAVQTSTTTSMSAQDTPSFTVSDPYKKLQEYASGKNAEDRNRHQHHDPEINSSGRKRVGHRRPVAGPPAVFSRFRRSGRIVEALSDGIGGGRLGSIGDKGCDIFSSRPSFHESGPNSTFAPLICPAWIRRPIVSCEIGPTGFRSLTYMPTRPHSPVSIVTPLFGLNRGATGPRPGLGRRRVRPPAYCKNAPLGVTLPASRARMSMSPLMEGFFFTKGPRVRVRSLSSTAGGSLRACAFWLSLPARR